MSSLIRSFEQITSYIQNVVNRDPCPVQHDHFSLNAVDFFDISGSCDIFPAGFLFIRQKIGNGGSWMIFYRFGQETQLFIQDGFGVLI